MISEEIRLEYLIDFFSDKDVSLVNQFQNIHLPLIFTNLRSRIIYANDEFLALTGYQFEDIYKKTPNIFSAGETPKEIYEELWHTISNNNIWRGKLKNRKNTGEFYLQDTMISPYLDNLGNKIGYLAIKQDTTEVSKDPLTSIYNRKYFIERWEEIHFHSLRKGMKYALMFIDLNKFKQINDNLGHIIGDEILIGSANKLKNASSRESDLVARLGGDEFIVLLQDVKDKGEVENVAKKIVKNFDSPFDLKNNLLIDLGVSIGIYLHEPNEKMAFLSREEVKKGFEHILNLADIAMYEAKDNCREQKLNSCYEFV